ncbi:MAG: hypothetical protein KF899_12320 [Parvibaculum sp.]|nr:hypothetical protein [Parvibaculum sp.]
MKIALNKRMPAIADPDGSGGKPISIFESGLSFNISVQGGCVPSASGGSRVEVDQWLFQRMAGLGPMTDQAHHSAGRRDSIPEEQVRTDSHPTGRPEGVCPGRDWRRGFIGDKTKEPGGPSKTLFGQRTQ